MDRIASRSSRPSRRSSAAVHRRSDVSTFGVCIKTLPKSFQRQYSTGSRLRHPRQKMPLTSSASDTMPKWRSQRTIPLMSKGHANFSPRIENRRAWHDYFITHKLECGIALVGSEVKSLRDGKAQLQEA